MIDGIDSVLTAVGHALGTLADYAAQVQPGWLALAVVLHYVAQVVRERGWWNILRASYPGARDLRVRDVVTAFLAGSGLNGVVPARGGDLVKVFLVHRRIPGARYATSVATFLPETLFETVCGTLLVAWALARGFLPLPGTAGELPTLDVSLVMTHPVVSGVVGAVLAVALLLLARRLRRRAQAFVARVRRGFAILGRPRAFVTGVASWQALSRLIRLGALACFMAAFGLPVSISTAVLVMAAQGGGRIIPIAPVSAGLRLAMLSYGFVEVTGRSVDIGLITTFTVGTSLVILVSGLAISVAILGRTMGTVAPRRAVAAARAALLLTPRRAAPAARRAPAAAAARR